MNLLFDIGGTNFRYCTDDSIESAVAYRLTENSYECIVSNITQVYKFYANKCEQSNLHLEKVLISIGGCIEDGKIMDTSTINYHDQNVNSFDLKSELSKIVKCKIIIVNDGECSLLGEKYFNRRLDNCMVLTLGTGVGIGIMLNGKIIKNSESSIEEKFSGKLFDNIGHHISEIKNGSLALGKYVSNIIQMLNLDYVIFNGTLSENSVVKQFTMNALERHTRRYYLNKCRILFSDKKNLNFYGLASYC